jgi:hypothetical protein
MRQVNDVRKGLDIGLLFRPSFFGSLPDESVGGLVLEVEICWVSSEKETAASRTSQIPCVTIWP